MRQVPKYLLIGNGRVARHFQHYFTLLQIPFVTWVRTNSIASLHQQLQQTSHVLLLIADDAIEVFIARHLINYNNVRIHCSGSLVTPLAYGAHPLMTFSDHLYSLKEYLAIPFVLDHDAPDFDVLMPGLPNQFVKLDTSLKAKYHALCVMSGNFSCLLWQKLMTSMEKEFNFPKEIAHAYLMQQTKNLIHNADNALTGPLVRNDLSTINKNIDALENDPCQKIYQAFYEYYSVSNSR